MKNRPRRHSVFCIASTALSLNMGLQAQEAKPAVPPPSLPTPATAPAAVTPAVEPKKNTPATPVPGRPVSGDAAAKKPVPEESAPLILPSSAALAKGDAVKQFEQKWNSKATVWHKTDTKTVESKLSTTKDVTMLSPLARHPLKPRPGTCRVVISGPQGGVRWDQEPLVTNGNTVLDIEAQVDVFMGDVPLKMALTYENSAGVHMGPAITVKGKPDEYTRVNLPSPLGGKSQHISGDKSDPLTGTQPVKFGVMIIPQGRQSTPVVVGIENFEVRVATASGATPRPALKSPASK